LTMLLIKFESYCVAFQAEEKKGSGRLANSRCRKQQQ
jgi:hypothetical protein